MGMEEVCHSVLSSIIVVVIIFGNMITLISALKFKFLRKQRYMYVFVLSLSISDMLLGIVVLMQVISNPLVDYKDECHWFEIPPRMNVVISILHIIIIAIDRTICIVMPLHYRSLVSKGTIKIMLAVAWTIPLILGSVCAIKCYADYASVLRIHSMVVIGSYIFVSFH